MGRPQLSQAFYGDYDHAPNSVAISSIGRSYQRGPTGYAKVLRETREIEAKIIEGSQLDNFSELERMKAGYEIPGQSFLFVDPFGNELSWSLDSPSSIGGVQVNSPVQHEDIKGSHGVNWIKCKISLQADYLQTCQPNQYISFSEVVTFTGRGQGLLVERTPANIPPLKQQVTFGSWYRATQEGEATSTDQNMLAMAPLCPQFFEGTEGDAVVTPAYAVETIRGVPVLWGRRWS
jgi:hypothetical protein